MLYNRGLEHMYIIDRNNEESVCVEHTMGKHWDKNVNFKIGVIGYLGSALQIQSLEAHYTELFGQNYQVIN